MSAESTVLIYIQGYFNFLCNFRRNRLIDELMTSLSKDNVLIKDILGISATRKTNINLNKYSEKQRDI